MNKIIKYLILLILFFSVITYARAGITKERSFNIFGYPYLFYTPETELALGIGGIATFYLGKDKILRPSKITLSGYYTTNKQYSFVLKPEFYFLKNSYFLSVPVNYEYSVDKYYGIGDETPEISNPDFSANIFSVSVNFQLPSLLNFNYKSGFLFDYKNYTILDRKTNPYLTDSLNVKGGNTVGVGFTWVWDTRDNIFFPLNGGYNQIKTEFYSETIGSEYDFNIYTVDLRGYFPVIKQNIIGLQIYGRFARGDPPFYELSSLGGQYMMRGYYEGRYRDKNFIMAQIEYRAYIFWKIGVVGFFGMGDVSDQLIDLHLSHAKYSYGFGIRYQFNKEEKVNLRADFGFGKKTSGVYFGIEEVF